MKTTRTSRKPAAKLPAYSPIEEALIAHEEAEELAIRDTLGNAWMVAEEAQDEGGWAW